MDVHYCQVGQTDSPISVLTSIVVPQRLVHILPTSDAQQHFMTTNSKLFLSPLEDIEEGDLTIEHLDLDAGFVRTSQVDAYLWGRVRTGPSTPFSLEVCHRLSCCSCNFIIIYCDIINFLLIMLFLFVCSSGADLWIMC